MTRVQYSKEELLAIADYVIPPVPAQKADVGFLFGTRHGVAEFCATAMSLWQCQMFTWLLVSGGKTGGQDRAEADIIAHELVARGMPREILILEDEALNTGDNVVLSRRKVAATIGLDAVSSLLVIGKVCSLRRYLMTLERHWPAPRRYACPVNYLALSPLDIDEFDRSRKQLLHSADATGVERPTPAQVIRQVA